MAGENGHNGAGASHLDWLRARHAAIGADRHLDLDVPGYEGHLVVRYGRVSWGTIQRVQDQLAKPGRDGEGSLIAQADFLIAACREIFFRDEDGNLTPLDPTGEPSRFDGALAALLQFDTKTARECVRELFRNDVALAVHAGEVMTWCVDTDADVSDDLLGESAPVVK